MVAAKKKAMSSRRASSPAPGGHDSPDTFNNSGAPLSKNQMMEERRKSRRPRQAFSALKASVTETLWHHNTGSNSESSSRDAEAGDQNGIRRNNVAAASRYLCRRDSANSQGGSERSNGGSGSDHGGSDSQLHRRRDTRTTFRLPNFRLQSSASPYNDNNMDESHFTRDRGAEGDESAYARTIRRYAVGQYVLISNHELAEGSNCLVNRYGFPEVGGGALSPEQRRGPYIYLFAQVKNVHFEEDAQYYTVSRCDNDEEQRADAGWMEPITDPIGIEAAKTAAKKKVGGDTYFHSHGHSDRVCLDSVTNGAKGCLQLVYFGVSLLRKKMKEQASKCLSGRRPYKISFKFTGVNFLVLCSIWYLYIDQVRLAFFPHSADFACAVVSW